MNCLIRTDLSLTRVGYFVSKIRWLRYSSILGATPCTCTSLLSKAKWSIAGVAVDVISKFGNRVVYISVFVAFVIQRAK